MAESDVNPRVRAAVAAAVAAITIALGAAAAAPAADFSLGSTSVAPKKAFFGTEPGVRVTFRFGAPGPTDVEVRIAGEGESRSLQLKQLDPGTQHRVEWDGLTDAGKPAPDGAYAVKIGPPGGPLADAGRFDLHGHFYPIRGPHRLRGAVGSFGAARNGGRIHHGLDVLARCGTPLAATRSGTVVRRRSNPRLDGNFVVVSMDGEPMTYRYSHLTRPAKPALGDHVSTGEILGFVGRTGNAGSTPCHLHIELRKRRTGFVDPQPILRGWDRFS